MLLSLVLIWYIAFSQIRIIFVNTCSVPYKVCLQFYNLQPKKGDLCVFDFLGKSFVKYIAGTAGDEISIVDNDVYVGSTHIGKIANASNFHPIATRKIPEGYVFMSGTHVYSFDSRYKDLLGGANDKDFLWGQIGNAHLTARIVNDTGKHYWILDDACQRYEELSDQGLCRYVSVQEDPPTDKFWKGKKVNGSWGQTVTYACRSSCKDTCQELKAKGCSRQPNPECLEKAGDKCLRWRWKFKCKDRVGGKKYSFSKKNPFCLGGDCVNSSYEPDKDMLNALGYLSILEAARKELDGTKNISIFKGKEHSCTKFPLSFKDCCGCNGWGISVGLTGCDNDSKIVAKLREENKCIQIGTYCAEHVRVGFAKFCLRKKTVFCCFGSKFAKLLQEQGKRQLGISFGSAASPNCRGFTPQELARIDFSKLDLMEITNDVMDKFKPNKGEHFAKNGELDRIREQMQKKISNGNSEVFYLQENMRHLTGSINSKWEK